MRFRISISLLMAAAACVPAHAKEVGKATDITTVADWILQDRNAWLIRRKQGLSSLIPGTEQLGVRFLNAFAANTKAAAHGQYVTVGQRHAYYDAFSYTLHLVKDAPEKLRCIRFFDAAADVTGAFNVGAVELWDLLKAAANLSTDSQTLMTSINAHLFERNIAVTNKLMFTWKEPRDPRVTTPTAAIDAMKFDLAMVEFEQKAVEAFLGANTALVTAKVKSELNAKHPYLDAAGLLLSGAGGAIARRRLFRETWLPAAGIKDMDFFKLAHRVALGQAYVFFLHGYSLNDFKAFKAGGAAPAPSCKGVLPIGT